MNQENVSISCDVCQDLIPLVKDYVASEDSRFLVINHMEVCETCRRIFVDSDEHKSESPDDKKVLSKIKRRIYFSGLFILFLGTFFGVYFSNTMDVFYNIIIMPCIGALSYFLLQKKWYYLPIGVLAYSYLWLIAVYTIEFKKFSLELLGYPILYTSVYTVLTLVGALIAALFNFAFKKEGKK